MYSARFVTIAKASELTGYSPDEIRGAIRRGAWVEGHAWVRAPDGRLLVDVKQVTCDAADEIDVLKRFWSRGQILRESTDLGELCGIYFLVRDREIVYVGQSTNVLRRIATHIDEGEKRFDAYSWMPAQRHQLSDLERAYIKALSPEYNQIWNCDD